MRTRAKEKWKTPQLVILTKGEVGEKALAVCKKIDAFVMSGTANTGCYEVGGECYTCDAITTS